MNKSILCKIMLAGIIATFSTPGFSAKLSGKVKIDGSSTVFPITEAVAEEFGKEHPKVRVTVGMSGTGGGFKKFLMGETDINGASRSIKDKEVKKAKEKKVAYLEVPVAFDGLTVVINKKNTWVKSLTVAQLKKIWQPGSKVKTWKDVDPKWPNTPLRLYGPGTDSGTFDYFTKTINGKTQASRSDFTKSEDDNVLVKGVAGDKGALGYFGYAYYAENKKQLTAVPIVNKAGKAVGPTSKSINSGTYNPLSRPIFIYVSGKAMQKPVVKSFVYYYMNNAAKLSAEVGYVPLPKKAYLENIKKLKELAANPKKALL